jgi:cytochrome c-type biogenesis protein CcmH
MWVARWIVGLSLLLAPAAACHRNIEPFDPDEQVVEPDLSAIFPEGVERSKAREPARPLMPMGRRRGAAATGPPLTGQVLLAPELAGRVPEGAVMFLMARAPDSGPPVAVKRIPSPEFPLSFELGPDDRLPHDMPFEGPFKLTARLDADGDAATRGAGDLQGAAQGTHQPGATGVTILIDEIL